MGGVDNDGSLIGKHLSVHIAIEGNGLHVTCNDMSGDAGSFFILKLDDTLSDLKDRLVALVEMQLSIVDEKSTELLDMSLPLKDMKQLTVMVENYAVQLHQLMEQHPDVGRILDAMDRLCFDVKSDNFDAKWTLTESLPVDEDRFKELIERFVGDDADALAKTHFVQILAWLVPLAESCDPVSVFWYRYDTTLQKVKHSTYQVVIKFALRMATQPVSFEAPCPVVCFMRPASSDDRVGIDFGPSRAKFRMDQDVFDRLQMNEVVGSGWRRCKSWNDLVQLLARSGWSTASRNSDLPFTYEVSELQFYALVGIQLSLVSGVCPVQVSGHLLHRFAAALAAALGLTLEVLTCSSSNGNQFSRSYPLLHQGSGTFTELVLQSCTRTKHVEYSGTFIVISHVPLDCRDKVAWWCRYLKKDLKPHNLQFILCEECELL